MGKLAVLFSGQGSQKPGMGKSLYENVQASKDLMDQAEKVRPGILELCFSGTQEELNKTLNAQQSVFLVDAAAYAALAEIVLPDMGTGFSLGEYAALYGAGVLSFEDALSLVIKRSGWMQEAAEKNSGAMAAVLGKTADEVDEIVKSAKGGGLLVPVNYNCPGQTVVAGDTAEIDGFVAYCKENKIKCMKLPLGGAFHSEHMASVADKILEEIEDMTFAAPAFSLYANRTALPYEMADMKQKLFEQTKSPVLFEQSARHMIANGADTFVEVGPAGTLSGFMKKIDKELNILNISDYETYLSTKEALKELGY